MIKQIINLLTLRLKIHLLFLVLFMFVKGLAELVSISSIPFLILYLLNPNKIVNFFDQNNLGFFSEIVINLHLTDVLVIVVLVFLLKNLFFFIINIYEQNFYYRINVKFRLDLLNHYLSLSYLDIIKNNISLIIRNISIEVVHFSAALTSLVKIANDSIMILVFLVFVFYISNLEFLFVFATFASLSVILFYFLKKKLKYYGERSVKGRGLYLKNITDIFTLIKDITLNNLEYYFFNLFSKNLKITERIDFFSNIVFSSTKLFFETFAVLLLCLLIYLNLESGSNTDELFAYLSVVSVAVIRMLPLFNTVLSEANKLQFRYGSVKTVNQVLSNQKKIDKDDFIEANNLKENNQIKFDNKVNIKNLNSNLLNKDILKNINLDITKGSKIALIGTSGSGKTTFLNHVSQLYEPFKNTIISDGIDTFNKKRAWQNLVSYMPQENELINGTLIENIALGINADKVNSKNLKSAIKLSCCDEFIFKLPQKENTFFGEEGFRLSGGQMQRICIARSLYKNFEILLMDEPTSSLDKKLELEIMNNIFQAYKDKTIIISLHKLELIEKFDYLIIFDQKKLYSYTKVTDINKNIELLSFIENLKKNEKK
jgi:ABC-type bacteriocin/lantibiotic exporter with double-glycine peptidase domain